jgi:hypothetical protein
MGWRIHGESSSLQDAWSQKILLEQNGRSTLFVSKEESFSHHWRSTMATKSTCLLLGAKISKESKKYSVLTAAVVESMQNILPELKQQKMSEMQGVTKQETRCLHLEVLFKVSSGVCVCTFHFIRPTSQSSFMHPICRHELFQFDKRKVAHL